MIKLFITNLGKYNEGDLIGEYLNVPFYEGELEEVLEAIGINEEYEEYFISDYETDLNIEIGEYTNITNLNEQIEEIQSLESDINIINGIIDNTSSDLDQLINRLRDGDYSILNNVTNNTDLGIAIMQELDCIELPSHIENCFDYAMYGEKSDYNLIDGDMAIAIY